MKVLYWLSFIPQVPFILICALCGLIAGVSNWIVEELHDAISYPIWLKLYQRKTTHPTAK